MFVYFIRVGADGPFKIGISKYPEARLRTLQTSHYEQLYLIGFFPGSTFDEQELHRKYEESRIRGEWYRAGPELALEAERHRAVCAREYLLDLPIAAKVTAPGIRHPVHIAAEHKKYGWKKIRRQAPKGPA